MRGEGLKPGYKKTVVGVIPEDWVVRSLGELFSLKPGFAFSSKYFSIMGPILLTPGNFRLNGGLYFDGRNTKRYSGKYAPDMVFHNGDMLIVMTDLTPDCNLLGKPAFIQSDELILHNQRIGKLVIKRKDIDVGFLYCFLLSRQYLDLIKEKATGSTVRHTSNTSIYSVLILLPPLPEQTAIAAALSDTDVFIGALETLIAKKRAIKQAAMQQLLTGKTRLPGFAKSSGYKNTEVGVIPEDWGLCQLDNLTIRIGSGITPTGGERVYSLSGRPFIRSQNVGWGHLILDDLAHITDEIHYTFPSSEIEEGDVLLNITGASIGRTTLADIRIKGGNVNQHVCEIRTDQNKLNPKYLTYFLLSNNGQRQIDSYQAGGNRQGLNYNQIGSFYIAVPPRPEQTAIATVLSDMDDEIAALEHRLGKGQQIKQGMMQQLLTGKVRLVTPQEAEVAA